MINLPPGFDLALFVSDFVSIITPILSVLWLFVVFTAIVKVGKKL